MEFVDEKKGNSDLLNIGLIIAGAAFLFWIIKSSQQKTQSIPSQQSQQQIYPQYQDTPISTYENAEEWQIIRVENGFIEDLKVGRNATIGNGVTSQSHQSHQSPVWHEKPTTPAITTSDLDRTIKELIKKNMRDINELNKLNKYIRLSDTERANRFGFA